ncbi:oxygenase MpaB family protein [Novosphingobium malaysiense]|uniref:oxygenase MpaB family protein n=1 Tax=Novosphingobium malaysiense TaxID=1348853 RepID=UPI001E3CE02A|nr:oxygenase MpaB family protein [Novosphingobium malaysiense]
MLVRQVRGLFNDGSKGERPVAPSHDALFEPDTPIRNVHADVVAMMIGGISALMLQMLHPAALRGVLDHSDFRNDMRGRLRRTARFIAVTTYGHRDDAEQAIRTVNAIHARVTGTMPDGTAYAAADPRTLAWVHVAEATSFLNAYRRYADPEMAASDQDKYFAQFAVIAQRLGAEPVPTSRTQAAEIMQSMQPDLCATSETRAVARMILDGEGRLPSRMTQRVLAAAALDLLPAFAREMLGLQRPGLERYPAVIGTQVAAEAVRWAFADELHRRDRKHNH